MYRGYELKDRRKHAAELYERQYRDTKLVKYNKESDSIYKVVNVLKVYHTAGANKNYKNTIKNLKEIKKDLIYLYRLKDEKDFRSGKETYRYETQESIESNLRYISDRWNCMFRIRWLLDLIEFEDDKIRLNREQK